MAMVRTRQESGQAAALGFSSAALLVGMLAHLFEGWWLWRYYQNTLSLPPGTGTRPMGLAVVLFLTAAGSFCVGIPLAVVGLTFSWKARNWPVAVLALISVGVNLLPWSSGQAVFHRIVAARGLVIED
jgi:hypothetical protein